MQCQSDGLPLPNSKVSVIDTSLVTPLTFPLSTESITVDTESILVSGETTPPVTGHTISIPQAPRVSRRRIRAFSRGSDLPFDIRVNIRRAGIVPYCIYTDAAHRGDARNASSKWFMVGVDAENGEITDFGGHRKPSESIEAAAARELFEETSKLVDIRRHACELLSNSPIVTDGTTCIFFLLLDSRNPNFGFVDELPILFMQLKTIVSRSPRTAGVYLENSVIYWICESELLKLVASRRKGGKTTRKGYGVTESDVIIPDWMINTREAISKLTPVKPAGDSSVSHPNVYPAIRKLVLAGLTFLHTV